MEEKTMKKTLALILAPVMSLSLVACGGGNDFALYLSALKWEGKTDDR